MAMYAQLPATPSNLPTTTIPVAPNVPPGWSIGPDGAPIDPSGTRLPPGTTFDPQTGQPIFGAESSSLPVASIGVMAIAGYLLGKPRGEEKLWAGVGAVLGYLFRPVENVS